MTLVSCTVYRLFFTVGTFLGFQKRTVTYTEHLLVASIDISNIRSQFPVRLLNFVAGLPENIHH